VQEYIKKRSEPVSSAWRSSLEVIFLHSHKH